MASTPAIAAAEQAGIRFTLHAYEQDPAADSYGLEAAEKLGVDPARVFKTLQIELAPGDFIRLTDARVHSIAAG